MPRRDGTGPQGMGAGTGRRLGSCSNELKCENNALCHGRARNNRGLGFKKSYYNNANLKKNVLKEKAGLTWKIDLAENGLNTL